MSKIQHQNIATFYGMSFDITNWHAVFESGQKGTLMEVLSSNCNEVFFDFEMRMAFVLNLIEGLHYIHHSPLRYHGNLSPEMCLINERYTLRISGVGISYVKDAFANTKDRPSSTQVQNKDVESLGQLMESICNDIQDTPQSYRNIASDCRMIPCPSVQQVRNKITRAFPRQGNIVELLLKRLEKHADDLEDTVKTRTNELVEEMGKVDLLLREMLPV